MKRRSFLKGAAAALAGLWATDPKSLIKLPEPPEENTVISGGSSIAFPEDEPWISYRSNPYFWDGDSQGNSGLPPGSYWRTVIVWHPDDNEDLPFPAWRLGKEIEDNQILDNEDDYYWPEDDWEDE